ncbi:MAG: SMI1/KNR4 family protein [Candidatus Melainabacteria bacterium]|nr:MAG: SMI1/KNR4 family protein [Candidatus Melainabacteria bacterium]
MQDSITPKLRPCKDDFIPCSLDELKEIEELLEADLPEDYKDFVLHYGWSFYSPSAVVKTIELPPEGYTIPSEDYVETGTFLGGLDLDDGQSLLINLKTLPLYEVFPKQMLVIADDIGSNQFLLGLGGEHKNKIYFWFWDGFIEPDYYESEGLPVPDNWQFDNMCLIANSFSDMLSRVIPNPAIDLASE